MKVFLCGVFWLMMCDEIWEIVVCVIWLLIDLCGCGW